MHKQDFRELLEAQLDIAKSENQPFLVIRLKRVLRNDRLFKKLHKKARKAVAARGGSWMDWLANGGFEQIIQWVMLLISLFSVTNEN